MYIYIYVIYVDIFTPTLPRTGKEYTGTTSRDLSWQLSSHILEQQDAHPRSACRLGCAIGSRSEW